MLVFTFMKFECVLFAIEMLSFIYLHIWKINNCSDNTMQNTQFQHFPAGVNVRQWYMRFLAKELKIQIRKWHDHYEINELVVGLFHLPGYILKTGLRYWTISIHLT